MTIIELFGGPADGTVISIGNVGPPPATYKITLPPPLLADVHQVDLSDPVPPPLVLVYRLELEPPSPATRWPLRRRPARSMQGHLIYRLEGSPS